jgi:uncharacterized protein DUF5681
VIENQEKGQFKPGQSSNPGGRPRTIGEVRDAARAHTVEAIERLAHWMRSNNPKASIAAATALLDRGWGKAAQPLTGEDGGSPIETRDVTPREHARRIAFALALGARENPQVAHKQIVPIRRGPVDR